MNTYTKLKDGTWGLRVNGPAPEAGATVPVTKRDGSEKYERIGAVLWSGIAHDGQPASLCSIAVESRARRANGCGRCSQTASRTAQIWEECDYCGAEPIYV